MISVIIPAYNAEKTIDRCLNSISLQTYKDLEIIVVDNGSTDNTPLILNKWKKKDIRIKVVFQNSKGPSFSRNKGLSISTGEYVTFCDADDYIEKDMYLNLYNQISQSHSDIVSSAIREIYENNVIKIRKNNKKNKLMSGIEAAISMLTYKNGVRTVVWDKLYKRSCIKSLHFCENLKRGEDTLFNIQAMLNCSKYSEINYVGYTYDHTNSVLTKERISSEKIQNDLYAVSLLIKYVMQWLDNNHNNIHCLDLYQVSMSFYLKICYQIIQKIVLTKSISKLNYDFKNLIQIYCNFDKKIIKKTFNLKHRFIFVIFRYCPFLYRFLYKIKHFLRQ